jgi:hypothetical protein
VVPVHNEQAALEPNVRRLRSYLDRRFPLPTTVDNARTDATWQRAVRLQQELAGVKAFRLDMKGRGRAVVSRPGYDLTVPQAG